MLVTDEAGQYPKFWQSNDFLWRVLEPNHTTEVWLRDTGWFNCGVSAYEQEYERPWRTRITLDQAAEHIRRHNAAHRRH